MFSTEYFTYTGEGEMPEEFMKIADLLEQQYFELITDRHSCRLVYMMNDAAESFIRFRNYRINGQYIKECSETITASAEKNNNGYMLVVHQGRENVFTLSFDQAVSETYLYNYGATGHFWIQGHEKMRILDYWLGIIREKYNIIGPDSCTDEEKDFAALAHFLPLRYYRSVPEKYMIENDFIYETTAEAEKVFRKLAEESGSPGISAVCSLPSGIAAGILSASPGRKTVDYIIKKIQHISSSYPDRKHVSMHKDIMKKAYEKNEKLKKSGHHVWIFREEPFENTEDDMEFSVTVLSEKRFLFFSKTKSEKIN